jgi:hypothetical protein
MRESGKRRNQQHDNTAESLSSFDGMLAGKLVFELIALNPSLADRTHEKNQGLSDELWKDYRNRCHF